MTIDATCLHVLVPQTPREPLKLHAMNHMQSMERHNTRLKRYGVYICDVDGINSGDYNEN